jgi:hypothetical protein
MHSFAASLRVPARRAALRATATTPPRTLSLRAGGFRRFSTESPKPAPKSSNTALYVGLGVLVAAAGSYLFFSADSAETTFKKASQATKVAANFVPSKEDYQKVRIRFETAITKGGLTHRPRCTTPLRTSSRKTPSTMVRISVFVYICGSYARSRWLIRSGYPASCLALVGYLRQGDRHRRQVRAFG